MRTVTYKSVLDQAAQMLGIIPADLSTEDAAELNGYINRRVRFAWETFFWPDLMRVEQRAFAPLYENATAYTAGDQVWYPAEDKYYQAITSTTGNLPTDTAFWAEAQSEYSADDWSATKTYSAGDQVWHAGSQAFYQAHTGHTNQEPPNASFWGKLIPFERVIPDEQTGETPFGEVKAVWNKNPRTKSKAIEVTFWIQNNGLRVTDWVNVTRPWVEFRIRKPSFTGETFDGTATYSAGDQVYFSGDYYKALSATSAGESPSTDPAKWEKIEFPYIFSEYVAEAAAKDKKWLGDNHALPTPNWNEKVFVLLAQEIDKVERQQRQDSQINMLTRAVA